MRVRKLSSQNLSFEGIDEMAKMDKVSIVWGTKSARRMSSSRYRYRYRNLFISGERKPDVTGDAIFGIIDS